MCPLLPFRVQSNSPVQNESLSPSRQQQNPRPHWQRNDGSRSDAGGPSPVQNGGQGRRVRGVGAGAWSGASPPRLTQRPQPCPLTFQVLGAQGRFCCEALKACGRAQGLPQLWPRVQDVSLLFQVRQFPGGQ